MFLFLPYLPVSMTTALVELKSKWLLELEFRTYWMKDTVPKHVLALLLVGGRRWCIWTCLAKNTFAHPIGHLWAPQWELVEEQQKSLACDSAIFSVGGFESRVCGKVLAYQWGTPDAFDNSSNGEARSMEEPCVDSVSLTHPQVGPRWHTWTFAAAVCMWTEWPIYPNRMLWRCR